MYAQSMDHDTFERLLDDILIGLPVEFKDFVRSIAWDQGHSSGYAEVLNIAKDMAGQLSEAFRKYERRIAK